MGENEHFLHKKYLIDLSIKNIWIFNILNNLVAYITGICSKNCGYEWVKNFWKFHPFPFLTSCFGFIRGYWKMTKHLWKKE